MWYRSSKKLIHDSETGYNLIAAQYSQRHHKLDLRDRRIRRPWIPRELQGLRIIDLWGGDGRLYKFFREAKVDYTVVDIAAQMMKKLPGVVHRVVADLEEERTRTQDIYDIGLCFFTLLHVSDLEHFFAESYRIIGEKGRLIVQYHREWKPMEHHVGITYFQIETYQHSYDEIHDAASWQWWKVKVLDIIENNVLVSKIYLFTK